MKLWFSITCTVNAAGHMVDIAHFSVCLFDDAILSLWYLNHHHFPKLKTFGFFFMSYLLQQCFQEGILRKMFLKQNAELLSKWFFCHLLPVTNCLPGFLDSEMPCASLWSICTTKGNSGLNRNLSHDWEWQMGKGRWRQFRSFKNALCNEDEV